MQHRNINIARRHATSAADVTRTRTIHIRNHHFTPGRPKQKHFYPRDAMLARVIEIAKCLSVRPSVCASVTRRYCVKTKKASGMISSPSGSPKTLVF